MKFFNIFSSASDKNAETELRRIIKSSRLDKAGVYIDEKTFEIGPLNQRLSLTLNVYNDHGDPLVIAGTWSTNDPKGRMLAYQQVLEQVTVLGIQMAMKSSDDDWVKEILEGGDDE